MADGKSFAGAGWQGQAELCGLRDDAINAPVLPGPILVAVLADAYANGANANFKGVASLFGSGTTGYWMAVKWATVTTAVGSRRRPALRWTNVVGRARRARLRLGPPCRR